MLPRSKGVAPATAIESGSEPDAPSSHRFDFNLELNLEFNRGHTQNQVFPDFNRGGIRLE